MSKLDVVEEIHKSARKNFKRRHVWIRCIDDLWQADLIDMKSYAETNNGYKFILVVLDTFSKFAWGVPLKSKTQLEVSNAMIRIFKNGRIPNNLQTDSGTEFYNKTFEKLMRKHKINHYSTYSSKKASIVERLIRTLKTWLFKYFSISGKYRWRGNPLNTVLDSYNNSIHRTTCFKPTEVDSSNEKMVRDNIVKSWVKSIPQKKRHRLKINDYVRVSKYKSVFEKGYTPNWSTEIFRVKTVNRTNPVTYQIEDLRNQKILGSFYEQELQKTKHHNTYLIEKILKHRKNKVFVKWLGFGENENSWINKNEMI